MEFIDLLLDNGEIIRLEVPKRFSDDCWQALENCIKRGDWFSTNSFEGCDATYLGLGINRINMRRVVGFMD